MQLYYYYMEERVRRFSVPCVPQNPLGASVGAGINHAQTDRSRRPRRGSFLPVSRASFLTGGYTIYARMEDEYYDDNDDDKNIINQDIYRYIAYR